MGLAVAGVAGARRTDDALPRLFAAAPFPGFGVLANDPRFTDAHRAEIAKLPEVARSSPSSCRSVAGSSPHRSSQEGGGTDPDDS